MNKKLYIELLRKEIKWCEKHKNYSESFEFDEGFIGGLEQAIRLLDTKLTVKTKKIKK